MLTEMQMHNILDYFARTVQGATGEDISQICDMMIEDGIISEEEYHKNEMEILGAIDARFFTCNQCSWTMPISEMSSCGDWECRDCVPENEDD
jgi:hypothetical protein